MTRQEYLDELRAALAELPADEAARACAFYEEMIDDRIEAGLDEQDAVAQMEPPAEAAARILDELPTVPRAIAQAQAARRTGCGRAALWAAVIVGSPLWVSVLIAALAFVLCGVIMLCIPFVMTWTLAVAFLLCTPVAIFAAGCAAFAGSGTVALVDLGIGLGMGGVGLLGLIAALFVTRFFVSLLGRFVRWVVSPFWKMPRTSAAAARRALPRLAHGLARGGRHARGGRGARSGRLCDLRVLARALLRGAGPRQRGHKPDRGGLVRLGDARDIGLGRARRAAGPRSPRQPRRPRGLSAKGRPDGRRPVRAAPTIAAIFGQCRRARLTRRTCSPARTTQPAR